MHDTLNEFEAVLQKGLQASQELLDILAKESEQLKNGITDESLVDLATCKKDKVSELEQFTHQLTSQLTAENLTLSMADIEHYIKSIQLSIRSDYNPLFLWREFTEIMRKCRQLNEHNGASLDLLVRHNQRALKILCGQPPQSTTLYGPDGSSYSEKKSQSLITV